MPVPHRTLAPNMFDQCLDHEMATWRWIQAHGGLTNICPGSRYPDPPWTRMPAQGKRFSKIGSIPLPAANATDTLVSSWRVPYGYDGCIVSGVFNTDGTLGFQQGSGDLTWRLQLNQRWVRDYGNVTTYIGSLTTPYNINSGQILLQSGQLVQMFVNRSVASGGTISGGRVVMATFGWTWPR